MNWRTQQMLDQLGRGINGAIAYTGGRNVVYNERPDAARPDPSKIDERGVLISQQFVMFKPNLNINAKFVVTLEPSDTYTVRLLKMHSSRKFAKTGKASETLIELTDVYCDELQSIVESTYDEWVREHQSGLITI